MFVFLPCFTFSSCDGIVVFWLAYSAKASVVFIAYKQIRRYFVRDSSYANFVLVVFKLLFFLFLRLPYFKQTAGDMNERKSASVRCYG